MPDISEHWKTIAPSKLRTFSEEELTEEYYRQKQADSPRFIKEVYIPGGPSVATTNLPTQLPNNVRHGFQGAALEAYKAEQNYLKHKEATFRKQEQLGPPPPLPEDWDQMVEDANKKRKERFGAPEDDVEAHLQDADLPEQDFWPLAGTGVGIVGHFPRERLPALDDDGKKKKKGTFSDLPHFGLRNKTHSP
ncbi:MAG: hypothetical protein K9G62_08860 [Alphaproteobacteria bacterium]|nr:hypothetical protein [Alphaproteobacteria bacterium]